MYCLCNKVISSKSRFGSALFQLGKWFVPGAIFNRVVKFAVTLFAARFKQYNSVVIALINYYEPDLVTSLTSHHDSQTAYTLSLKITLWGQWSYSRFKGYSRNTLSQLVRYLSYILRSGQVFLVECSKRNGAVGAYLLPRRRIDNTVECPQRRSKELQSSL